jgi:hypothetical protein
MVMTTPISRASEHQSWHRFVKGLCLYCGWYCEDCPVSITTCKCEPKVNVGMLSIKDIEDDNTGDS